MMSDASLRSKSYGIIVACVLSGLIFTRIGLWYMASLSLLSAIYFIRGVYRMNSEMPAKLRDFCMSIAPAVREFVASLSDEDMAEVSVYIRKNDIKKDVQEIVFYDN